jgi:hypothetical protein
MSFIHVLIFIFFIYAYTFFAFCRFLDIHIRMYICLRKYMKRDKNKKTRHAKVDVHVHVDMCTGIQEERNKDGHADKHVYKYIHS